jgi:uncharacterized protein YjfI (DUF2170 family)
MGQFFKKGEVQPVRHRYFKFKKKVDKGDEHCMFVLMEDYGDGRGIFVEMAVCQALIVKPRYVYPFTDLVEITECAADTMLLATRKKRVNTGGLYACTPW